MARPPHPLDPKNSNRQHLVLLPEHEQVRRMTITRMIVFLAAVQVFPDHAKAGPCDVLISEIVERTGATFDRFSPRGTNAFLRHPLIDSFTVDCSLPKEPMVSAYWSQNAFPPNPFFAAVAAATSALTSERPDRIEAGLRRCNRQALAQPASEMADVNVGMAHIECHSFTRDGGSVGFSITKGR